MILSLSAALACEAWAPLTKLADVEHPQLTESSGLAASRRTPGVLWTHDDSGDPTLFRFALDGTVSTHEVAEADNRDWEDIASAACNGRGDCLYIGDIGSDRGNTGNIEVFVVREPTADGFATLVDRWELTWPGVPRDAETLLVHPCTLDAWIVTKGQPTEVFAISSKRGRTATDLVPVATLSIDQDVTGGDFSPDGLGVVLRSDDRAWRWVVDLDAPDAHWTNAPIDVVDGLESGEGVAWDLDGDLLFTAEGFPTAVRRMACDTPLDPEQVCTPSGCGCDQGPGRYNLTGLLWLGLSGLVRRRRRIPTARPRRVPAVERTSR